MRAFFTALAFCMSAALCLGQTAENEPATRDDVILYLHTMHSHDMLQKLMEVQSQSMQQLFHDQLENENAVPADYDAKMKKAMDELIHGMPVDEMTEAMIPSYQRHFTHSDIVAMNAFYSSAVGQKVLEELPAVTQESEQAFMPVLVKYLEDWKQRMSKRTERRKRAQRCGNRPWKRLTERRV